MAEFGECIHYKPLKGDPSRDNKLEARWKDGVWLGIRTQTDEVYIGTKEGVVKARDIKWKPKEQRWDIQVIKEVKGVPWDPCGLGNSDVPVHIYTGIEDVARRTGGNELEQAARDLYVTRGLLKRFGYTAGCRGCNALQYGTKQEAHSAECRKRIVQRLQETEGGRGKIEEI